MIEKLNYNPQHYVEKWTKWALTPTGRNHKTISANIQYLYEQSGLKPAPVIVCDTLTDFISELKQVKGVSANVRANVRDNVVANVRDNVVANVWDNVSDNVSDNVRDNVSDNVSDNVWANVVANVVANVRDNVRANVRDNVVANVVANVGAYLWANDISFGDVFIENNCVTDKKLIKAFYKYVDCLADTCVQYLTEDLAVVLVKPKIYQDTQNRLHREDGKAIEWQDGSGFYYLHGVKFDEKPYKKVVGGKMTFKQAMSLVDIDQRWVAIKFLGDKILKNTDNELLDKSKRGNELYAIKDLFPSHKTAYYLRYSCPSTGRVYFSGIDPEVGKEKNADLCMAWKHNLSLEGYQLLELENEG